MNKVILYYWNIITFFFRLYNICKKYAMVVDLCRDACAYLTSQFLTRTDTKDCLLPEYFQWACDVRFINNIFNIKNESYLTVTL